MHFDFHKSCDAAQLFSELAAAGVPVRAVYEMGGFCIRVTTERWARESVVNEIVEAHVIGTYQAPVSVEQGPQGPPGPEGPAGAKGDKGDKGDRGENGERGASGLDGADGAQGVPGQTGPQGDPGDTGSQGPIGLTGEQGLTGNDIRAGQWVDLVYDGTNMQMQSTLGNAPGGAPSGAAGGALGGTYPNPTVKTVIALACSDESTPIVAAAPIVTFRMPHAMTLTAVRASLTTAAATGTFTIDVKEGGTTIFSTLLTIDATEKTSTTAATPAVISDASLADDAEITIEVTDDASGDAVGLKVYLIGTRA